MLKKKVTSRLRKFLLLTGASAIVFFVSVLLHNLIYGLFGIEESFFFFVATIICPLGFLIGTVGSVTLFIRQRNLSRHHSDR